MKEVQEEFDELWRTAAVFSAKARAAHFREAANRARESASEMWFRGQQEEAEAMRSASFLLLAESERAWPMLGGAFLTRGTVEDAPTLPEPVAHAWKGDG